MSTRATYKIKARDNQGATFYIHYDGYPEGAAVYLHNMVLFGNTRGGFPAMFIRANDLAEFTGDHESHGDTEFRYTVNNHEIKADARDMSTDKWRTIYNGSLAEFINKHGRDIDNFVPIICNGYQYNTEKGHHDELFKRMKEVWEWKGRGATGNASSTMSEVIRGIKAIRLQVPGFGKDLEKMCRDMCLEFGKSYGWKEPAQFETRFIDDELYPEMKQAA
jgi:hypothetical protein